MKKKVIVVVVDSLLPGPLEMAMSNGKAPNMQQLAAKGKFIKDGVTVFPTMSSAIDTSLVTGVFPDEHKVPGLVWYDAQQNRVINYGSSFGTVWRLGFRNVVEDILYHLNEKHISKFVSTIFEDLASEGLSTGNISLAAHRGNTSHEVRLPWLVKLLTMFALNKPVRGAEILSLGRFTDVELYQPYQLQAPTSAWKRYGVNDTYAVALFREIVRQNALPDFISVYLPDLDQAVHKHGTKGVIEEITKVDTRIGHMMESMGGVESATEQAVWILTSDHGQTDIHPGSDGQIDLRDILQNFTIHNFRKPINPATLDVLICNNERMAYLYTFRMKRDPLVDALKEDHRIDFIAYPREKHVVVEKRYHGEKTPRDAQLIFSKDGPYEDIYGQTWNIQGDAALLDIKINDMQLCYEQYPDALRRLYGATHAHSTDNVLTVTAKPGFEFQSQGSAKHGAGASHGSLHRQDSLIPMIIAGTDRTPKHARLVDLKEFVISLL